jgi:hypothetical protein
MERSFIQLSRGALAGACFVAFLAMLALASLSCTDKIAMIGFSISIPLNIFIWASPVPPLPNAGQELLWPWKIYVFILTFSDKLAALALAFTFAHFGLLFGALFLLSSVAVYSLYAYCAVYLVDDDTKHSNDDL